MSLRKTRPTLRWYEDLDPYEFTKKGFYKGKVCLPTSLHNTTFHKSYDGSDIGDTTWGKERVKLDKSGSNGVELISLETSNGIVVHLNKYKNIHTTSAIFVQLIYSAISTSHNDTRIALFPTPISPLFSIIDKESYTLKCLELSQRDTEFLQSFSCVIEKEYLIKIGNGMYLSLTYEGVVAGTLKMFRQQLFERVLLTVGLVLAYEVTMENTHSHLNMHSSVRIAQLRKFLNAKQFRFVLVHDYFRNGISHIGVTKSPIYTPILSVYKPLTICVSDKYSDTCYDSPDSLGLKYNSPNSVLCGTYSTTKGCGGKTAHDKNFSIMYGNDKNTVTL